MANIFDTLVAPATDGVGPSVAVDEQDAQKTILVQNGPDSGFLTIQGSCDGGTLFQDIPGVRFDSASQKDAQVLALFSHMRVRREDVQPGGVLPVINVAAPQSADFSNASMNVPAGDGVGTPVNFDDKCDFATYIVSGDFTGRLVIEGSQEAAGNNFAPLIVFGSPQAVPQRVQSVPRAIRRARVVRSQVVGGTAPTVAVASAVSKGTILAQDGTLTDAATIVVDARNNRHLNVTIAAGPRTFGVPSNPTPGQRLTFIVESTPGGIVPVWTAGAGGYRFANALSPEGVRIAQVNALFTAQTAGTKVHVTYQYDAADDQWDAIDLRGFF